MAEKELKLSVAIETGKADKSIAILQSSFSKFLDIEKNFLSHFENHSNNLTDSIGKMVVPITEVASRIKALEALNLKAFGTIEKLNEERMKGLLAEIEAESKKGKAIEKTNELYKKKEQLILEQAETAKQKLEKEYAMLIEAAEKTKSDITAIENAKKENLVLIDKKLKEDLKKNNEEHYTAQKAFVDKSLKETTELLTKNIYHGKEKLDKDSREKIKRLEIEYSNQLKLEKDRYTRSRIAAIENGKSLNDVDAENLGRLQALKIAHEAKIAKINEEAAKKAKGTATEAAKATTEKATEAATKSEDAAKKAEGAWTRIINVSAMSKNIYEGIKNLKHYDEMLTISMQEQIVRFEKLEKEYSGDAEGFKALQEAKKDALAKYAAEKVRIDEMITTAEEKQNGLRMEQLRQYAEKTKEITKEINTTMTKTSEYFGSALGSISNVYKAEIDGIDENLKKVSVKIKEAEAEEFDRKERLSNYQNELKDAQKGANQELINELQNKVQKEIELEDTLKSKKEEVDKEKEKLENKKKKKEVEQEKIEKLKRKADLVKNIGEGIFNIAQGVTKALSYGPILGPILAAVVSAAGAVQVAIMTKQLAKFADGGLLSGKLHSQGGIRINGTNIEVEGGEYIINRETTGKNLGLIRYINSQRKELTPTDINNYFSKPVPVFNLPFRKEFEAGGQMPVIHNVPSADNGDLIDAIKSIKITPKVAVTDIIRAQDEAVTVDRWSGV
ncbi:MAG: hypothetical protein E6767_14125 [Dysgonomonas sp.]|nr:hypothetical protein [Dysgonomonas sp.]